MKKLLISLLATTVMSACHHAPPKADESETASPTTSVSTSSEGDVNATSLAGPVPSQDRILSSYSLLQLDAALNAYKMISDESMGRPQATEPINVFGCPVLSSTAKSATLKLQSLIESKIVREQSSYIRTPATYLRTREAATCETSCSCGVLLEALSGFDVRVLKKAEQARHEDLLLELQSKSSRQGPTSSMECAKKQNWICGSDLQKYVSAHSQGGN